MTKQQLRKFWFQIHKWLGLSLAIVIIPISLTGAALVWHDDLELALNPERRTSAQASLKPNAYSDAALSHAARGERLASLAFDPKGGPVVAALASQPQPGGGRPVRTMLYLHPADARLLDTAKSNEGVDHV